MKNILKKALVIRLILAIVIMASLPIYPAQAAWTDSVGDWIRSNVAQTVWAEKTTPITNSLATVQITALMTVRQPLIGITKVYETFVTGYSSSVDETDDTPFITASGEKVRDGIIAANFLPFGTKVRIPDIFGNKIFVVKDRMASKHADKVDIWFATKELAKSFGRKKLEVEIIDPSTL